MFIDLKESLKRPECYEAGKAPSSCQDLYCIGYKLPGFYFVKGENKMQTVYCDFNQIETSHFDHPGFVVHILLKFVRLSIIDKSDYKEFQTRRFGYANILTESVYFYVQRSISHSTPDAVPVPVPCEPVKHWWSYEPC